MNKCREALIIIDMLNDFVKEKAPLEVSGTRSIIKNIKKEILNTRNKGGDIIFVCDAHETNDLEFENMGWPLHAIKGTDGAKIIEELAPEANDIIIEKSTYSGFYNTKLEKILKDKGIGKVTIVGCVTNICILYTAADSVMRGIKTIVKSDCVADIKKSDGNYALEQMRSVLGVDVI